MDITLIKHGSLTRWTFRSAENGYVRVNSVAEYTRVEAAATISELQAQGWTQAIPDEHLNDPFATDEIDEFGSPAGRP